jgi:hypothetical protein
MLRGQMCAVQDRLAFWTLTAELGPGSFVVRRTLQRIHNDELTVLEAERVLRAYVEPRVDSAEPLR